MLFGIFFKDFFVDRQTGQGVILKLTELKGIQLVDIAKFGMNGKEPETWDNSAPHDLVAAAIEKGLGAIVWGGNYFDVRPSRGWLAWYKPDGPQSFADFELGWTSFDMNTRLFIKSAKSASLERGVAAFAHPNQKPVGLIEWCIDLAPKNTLTIADPFAGSGTTGVACVRMGKKFYGIERERKYFDIMCERITRAYQQLSLFQASEPSGHQRIAYSQATLL